MTKVDTIGVSIISTLVGLAILIWLFWVSGNAMDFITHNKNSKAMFRKLVEANNKMVDGQGGKLTMGWEGEVFE